MDSDDDKNDDNELVEQFHFVCLYLRCKDKYFREENIVTIEIYIKKRYRRGPVIAVFYKNKRKSLLIIGQRPFKKFLNGRWPISGNQIIFRIATGVSAAINERHKIAFATSAAIK